MLYIYDMKIWKMLIYIFHYASMKRSNSIIFCSFQVLKLYNTVLLSLPLLLLIMWIYGFLKYMLNEVLAMKVDSSNSLYTIIRLSVLFVFLWWYYGLDRFVMLSLCHLFNLKNVLGCLFQLTYGNIISSLQDITIYIFNYSLLN